MTRWTLVAAVLCILAAPLLAGDCQIGAGSFSFAVLGPEAHNNLWQFASVRGWSTVASTSHPGGHNHARLVFEGPYYGVADNPCQFGLSTPDGTTLLVVAEYASDQNTPAQRAYFAAASFPATHPAPTIPDATMREVPPALASHDAGTVTVSWSAVPSQAEVTGYQVVRSADGVAGWTNVGAVTTQTSATDSPGTGTWFYAVEVAYLGVPTQQVSPHGLAAGVTVP